MTQRKGQVSVETENIFPIIRKWLYSDRDIFLRELLANAQDATRKLETLERIGEVEGFDETTLKPEDRQIDVRFAPEQKLIVIEDQGLGMNEEELDQYINRIAYSGALDFVKQYENQTAASDQIIGHFGLGFYSAFMVADRVAIDTLSYRKEAKPCRWVSEDGIDYTLETFERGETMTHEAEREQFDEAVLASAQFELSQAPAKATPGTRISIWLDEENQEEIDGAFVFRTLKRYCRFFRDPIMFKNLGEKNAASDEAQGQAEEAQASQAVRINPEEPLWEKSAHTLSDSDYVSFYHQSFADANDPLLWIHLNMDYPFKIKGILYFPKQTERIETLDGRISLFANRVFVADQLKSLIPEFLFLLKGMIDCPDLPLNVSRSYLQNDAYLKKLSDHIVRKLADQLLDLQNKDPERYQAVFQDVKLFVRYGCLTHERFQERISKALLFEKSDGSFVTKEELPEKVYYTTNLSSQHAYVKRHERVGHTVLVMEQEIDEAFMQNLSMKAQGKLQFIPVDVDLGGEKVEDDALKLLEEKMSAFLTERVGHQVTLRFEKLGEDEFPILMQEDAMRRYFEQMQKHFGTKEAMPEEEQLILNVDHRVVKALCEQSEFERQNIQLEKLYRLGRLLNGRISPDEKMDLALDYVDLLGHDVNR